MIGTLEARMKALWRAQLDDELVARIACVQAQVGHDGVDPFGFDPTQLETVVPVVRWFYRHYFRVTVEGLERLPEGRVLLVANHSGQIPLDAVMIGASVILEGNPPRVPRAMVERWVPSLPVVSTFFARVGQVLGTPANCRRLLEDDEAVLVFPEGVRGISKPLQQRYQLQRFGHGFMRLALETGAPIVPVAVVGAEEQYPVIHNAKGVARMLGLPAAPISPLMAAGPLAAVPLPVRYRLYFGHPMRFSGHFDDDEGVVEDKVTQVKDAIAAMIDRGLRERRGWFA